MIVPCGRCRGCRAARSSDWAVRIQHELKYHSCASFLTLTYDDFNLPYDYSVSIREVQLFIKRLRKDINTIVTKSNKQNNTREAIPRIRYFAVGEYGDKSGRPHYHIIVFGWDFPDRYLADKSKSGHPLYESEQLNKLWGKGIANIGTVTPESGGYVARYSFKKINTVTDYDYYTRIHPGTGEVVQVHPEFATMSTHPGIGFKWFDEYEGDVYPHNNVIIKGQKYKVPDYYKKKMYEKRKAEGGLVEDDPHNLRKKFRDVKWSKQYIANNTLERREVREEVARLRHEKLFRDL